MASIAEAGIELFGSQLPDLEQLKEFETVVNSSEFNMLDLGKLIEENDSNSIASGIGLHMLGQFKAAIEKLQSASDCKEKFLYLGMALRDTGDYDGSLKAFDKAAGKKADSLAVSLEKAETLRVAGKFDESLAEIGKCSNFEKVSADYHFQLGRVQENLGLYEDGIDNFEVAIDLDNDHQKALFHLGYSHDLRGNDLDAVDYYKEATKAGPPHVNSLLNLAVLYEDMGEYKRAQDCVSSVLMSHPNHQKAILFLKDIESSMVMIYDEEKEKLKTRHCQTLEIPISDFELSVRSRNCLKKMNIHTLGDLLRITEAELLSYKNFGETSLVEIKKILDEKTLTLGMELEENGSAAMAEIPEGANQELIGKHVDDLELSVRAKRALGRLGTKTVGELISKTEAELLGCKNFGVTSLEEIKERLEKLGLSLRKLD
jgi:DNA-directed RNA polymerase subunit alpha